MSIQLPIGPHSTASLIRSDSNFEVDYITLNNLYSSNTINTNNLNVTNIFEIYNDLNVHNNLTITGDINLISGDINLNNDLNISGNLNINGDITPNSINVTNGIIGNNLNITNDIISNNINVSGNLTVTNDTILKNSLIVNGNNLVVDNTNLRIGINVTNPIEALDVNGNSNLRNNLVVDGSVLIRGQDNFNEVNFESFSKWTDGLDPDTQIASKPNKLVGIGMTNPTNLLDISGSLNIKDNYKIDNEIALSKNTIGICITSSSLQEVGTLNSLNITGLTNMSNDLTVDGNINITGNTIQTGNLNITGEHKLNNFHIVNNDLINITSSVNFLDSEFKIENNVNNSIKRLPPQRLSGNIHEIIGNSYGNGIYNLSSSSNDNNLVLYQIMDEYNDTYFGSDKNYNATTGVYEGSNSFNSINGEWIKFEIAEANILDNFQIKIHNDTIANNNPIDFKLYGSADDTNWTLLSEQIDLEWVINNVNYTIKTFNITDNNTYKYFTIVVTKCGGINETSNKSFDHFNIIELIYNFELNYQYKNLYAINEYIGIGTTNPQNSLDVLGDINVNGKFKIENIDIFNSTLKTNLREYPSQVIDINTLKLTTTGEITEQGTIINPIKGYGEGSYNIYYSSIRPFFLPNGLGSYIFDKRNDENYYYRSKDTYNTNTGIYSGNSSLNDINGEYIILHLPNKMLLQTYRIYNNIYDSEYMSPNTFKILGSNDKIGWIELDSQANQNWTTTNEYNYKEYTIYTTLLFEYYAIVVTRVGNDTIFNHRDALKIQSLVYYGVEFNKYGVNYDTGLYINGSMKVVGDLAVDGDMNFETITATKLGLGVSSPTNGIIEVQGSYGEVGLDAFSYNKLTSDGTNLGISATSSYSIYADGKIAGLEFNAVSDLRVKNIINERDVSEDLKIIKKMNTYDYSYIDKIHDGSKEKIGFIAQELKSINENFTNESKRFIPNIYDKFQLKTKNKIITRKKLKLDKQDLIKVEVCYKNKPLILEVNVIEITENEIYINNNLDIDLTKGIFIYGKYVNNFLTIDINQITSVNTNVIKHLLSRIEDLEEFIKYIGDKKRGW